MGFITPPRLHCLHFVVAMVCLTIAPRNLRFTQDSIAVRFQKERPTRSNPNPVSKDGRIDEAVKLILAKKLRPAEFPNLRVVKYAGVFWSMDNRRLWVFRKAEVPQISVTFEDFGRQPKRFADLKAEFSTNSALLTKMSGESFFPRVRGACTQTFKAFTQPEQKRIAEKLVPAPLWPPFQLRRATLDRRSEVGQPNLRSLPAAFESVALSNCAIPETQVEETFTPPVLPTAEKLVRIDNSSATVGQALLLLPGPPSVNGTPERKGKRQGPPDPESSLGHVSIGLDDCNGVLKAGCSQWAVIEIGQEQDPEVQQGHDMPSRISVDGSETLPANKEDLCTTLVERAASSGIVIDSSSQLPETMLSSEKIGRKHPERIFTRVMKYLWACASAVRARLSASVAVFCKWFAKK